jgi:hypothetical protein
VAKIGEDLNGLTSAETVKLIIKVVMHDLPSMPTGFLDIPDRRKQELWVTQLSSRLSQLATSSVEILSPWLSKRIRAAPLEIPKKAILSFVVDHIGIDVSAIQRVDESLSVQPDNSDAAARGPGTSDDSSLSSDTSHLIESSFDVLAIKNVKKKLVRESHSVSNR